MNRLNVVRNAIDRADAVYYRTQNDASFLGINTTISDAEYDALKKELQQLCPNDERLTRVGYADEHLDNIRTKVSHSIPMGSLDNIDGGINGYEDWYKSISDQVGECPNIMASHKVDGASICASYKNGKLIRVATRGNGTTGEDITANAMLFKQLPHVLPEPLDIEVRGEVVLHVDDFRELCQKEFEMPFDQIPEEELSNPRNYGNGIIGRLNGENCDLMRFYAFNLVGLEESSESDKFAKLSSLGFTVVSATLCETPASFLTYFADVERQRDSLPYHIDGVVVTIDSHAIQNEFITSDIKSRLRPKYSRAVKFSLKSAQTQLLGVVFTVGHNNAIYPTAKLQEVRIGGVNVSRALLNNWDEIERLDVAVNDTVEVVLSGDIIPKVISVVKRPKNRIEIAEPTKCPICGHAASRTSFGPAGANVFCSNVNCPGAVVAKIKHWIGSSKKGVGIMGLGDAMIYSLWSENIVSDPADLYTLTVETLANLEIEGRRIGESRAQAIVDSIKEKSKMPLHVFLGALGIDLLGSRRAQQFIKDANGNLDTIGQWYSNFATIELPGLGDIMRSAILRGLDKVRPLVSKLVSVGVTIQNQPQTVSGIFSGKSFCFTGTRDGEDAVQALGGTIKNGVSKNLDYLVQKDSNSQSSKTEKARKLGVKVISVDDLATAMNSGVLP